MVLRTQTSGGRTSELRDMQLYFSLCVCVCVVCVCMCCVCVCVCVCVCAERSSMAIHRLLISLATMSVSYNSCIQSL